MFRSHSSPSPAHSYGDAFMHHAAASFPAQIPRAAGAGAGAGGYIDGGGNAGAATFSAPFAASTSPPSAYSSASLPSSYYNIHRSISSHSLPLHLQLTDPLNGGRAFFSPPSPPAPSPHQHQLPLPPLSSSPSSSTGDLFEFTSPPCPVRRVFSTGDLQGMNGSSPSAGESCGGQDGGGGPLSQKVGRYSAEERKERIERYRVKRHQRNFNKKITYACRKTLADSRPRVKGRFARNGEAEGEGDADEREASDTGYGYCGYSSGYHVKDGAAAAFGGGGDNGEWWWRAPGAAAAAAGEAERQRVAGFDVDDELWATLGDMVSVNLAS